jgi:hypothetical protein
MQECCPCGSVRGALGNQRPYRDIWVTLTRTTWVAKPELRGTSRLRSGPSTLQGVTLIIVSLVSALIAKYPFAFAARLPSSFRGCPPLDESR